MMDALLSKPNNPRSDQKNVSKTLYMQDKCYLYVITIIGQIWKRNYIQKGVLTP